MSQTTEIISKLQKGEFESPKLLADYLVQLSATLMTAYNFETEAEVLANAEWLKLKKELKADGKEKSDKQIDRELTQTEAWQEWRKIRNANKAIEETIKSLKKKLRSLEEEMRL